MLINFVDRLHVFQTKKVFHPQNVCLGRGQLIEIQLTETQRIKTQLVKIKLPKMQLIENNFVILTTIKKYLHNRIKWSK